MTLKRVLFDLMKVVLDEATKNEEFACKLNEVLNVETKAQRSNSARAPNFETDRNETKDAKAKRPRPANRRAPAVLDPVQLARENPLALREALRKLSLEQLLDVVAEYGMDTGKLVMKWKDPERIMERIAEVSTVRAHKGDAFRREQDISPADPPIRI